MATNSERLHAKLERMRRGGPALTIHRTSTKPRRELPGLPWWGGVGPVLWRQLATARRDLGRTLSPVCAVALFAGMAVYLFHYARAGQPTDPTLFALGFAAVILAFSFLFSVLLNFDFRGDFERIEHLKALPIAVRPLVVGQVTAPVLLTSVPQILGLCVLGLGLGRVSPWFWALPIFTPLLNAVLVEVDNLMFLWFPSRPVAATPGDIQAVGRAVVLMLAKVLTISIAVTGAGLTGGVAYLIGGWIAAAVAAWLVLLGIAVVLLWPINAAFRHFDVAGDAIG